MRSIKLTAGLVGVTAALLILARSAGAVPAAVSVQGRLTDSEGLGRNGSFSVKFTVYTAETGGTLLWTKTISSMPVRGGTFQALLAETPGQPRLTDVFSGGTPFLELQVLSGPGIVSPEEPMIPRQPLVSVPFALHAAHAAVADAMTVVSAMPTRQVLTSGTSATYTTPAGARQLRIRMVGGGGGGAGTHSGAGAGGNGGDTSFHSIVAKGGGGGSNSVPGGGGTGGSGSASFRVQGASAPWNIGSSGGDGASGPWGGGGAGVYLGDNPRNPGAPNSGSGGGSSWCNGCSPATGHGGGAGEYAEIIISNPAASYTYTVGAGGAGGPAASYPGAPGGSGVISVDEIY